MCILGYVEFYIEQSTFFRSLKEHPEHETFRNTTTKGDHGPSLKTIYKEQWTITKTSPRSPFTP